MSRVDSVKEGPEWKAIAEYYGDRTAARSKIPLINHIEEGLRIMDQIDAAMIGMRAFCIHPMCQADIDLVQFNPNPFSPMSVLLAMEYRKTAMQYLPRMDSMTKIKLSPIKAVNDMLIADKVQNKKDFLVNQALYPNRLELDYYFDKWLTALGVSTAKYKALTAKAPE